MTSTKQSGDTLFDVDRSRYDHHNEERIVLRSEPGIREEVVRQISVHKNEPDWMLQKRLNALRLFLQQPLPTWGPSLEKLDLNAIHFFLHPDAKHNAVTWDDVPQDIKRTFDKLGIPEAEKRVLAGVGAQYESTVVYHSLKKEWEDQGVLFLDCDEAVKSHPELVQKYFMTTCVSPSLHKFAALHAAVWSGGTFIYVPKGVKLTTPLQAYFRMNAQRGGQFEHTIIIADEGSEVHYIEGCSAPQYNTQSIHAGCVEIHVLKGARVRYSSIENWSKNTYNLNTKRAVVYDDGVIEWVNGNLGSGITMLYPTSILVGECARADFLGVAFAGKGQNQDTGSKVIHVGKRTSSTITSKSLSKDGGITSYRGLVSVRKGATQTMSSVVCDALMLDNQSHSNTYPFMDVHEKFATVSHEASVGKINETQLFYLATRGLDHQSARNMVVSGFIEPIVKSLPLEYAVELNRLVELEMQGA